MALRIESSGEKKHSPAKHSSPKKKRSRDISFYAAILLCVGAVAFTAAANRSDTGDRSGEALSSGQSVTLPFDDIPAVDESLAESWPVSDLPVTDTQLQHTTAPTAMPITSPEAPSRMNLTQPTEPAVVPASAPITFRMPSGGSITAGFSGDELVFCSTMCDWRVHNGIDISGETGGEVKACADGIVEAFAADMLYGNTAVVRHADDSVMYYSGLNDTQMVSAGLEVHAGDVIGYIGEVPCELADGPHIHLSMVKDGKFIDPASLFKGQ